MYYISMRKGFLFCAVAVFCATILATSCSSTPTIPEDANAMRLIQMGQDAMSLYKYKQAAFYYQAVLHRFGMDTAIYVEASYELGHLYSKLKKWALAAGYYKEILEIFDSAPYGTLPAAYKKLSQMGLDAMSEKYSAR